MVVVTWSCTLWEECRLLEKEVICDKVIGNMKKTTQKRFIICISNQILFR